MTRAHKIALVGLLLCLACSIGAPSAAASARITRFTVERTTRQAGGHPDLHIEFELTNRVIAPEEAGTCGCNDARNTLVSFPQGVIGNPHATPQCDSTDFAKGQCPLDSQIGRVEFVGNPGGGFANIPLYNLVPQPNEAGLTGWKIPLVHWPVYTVLSARTRGDYGLDANNIGILQLVGLQKFNEELWGVPADPSHDHLRVFNPDETAFGTAPKGGASDSPLIPFLQNPTACTGSTTSNLTVLAYDGGVTQAESSWPPATGCDQLSFNPSLSAQPTTSETDAPSGLEVDLKVPQTISPTTPSQSEIREAAITLPPGFSINANAADGKAVCSEAEAQLGQFASDEAAHCPDLAKIGTVIITSAALPGPIPGAVYLGEPQPGNRYRIFLVADGFATHIKLAGTVTAEPGTGQVTTRFQNLPQSPLTEFNLHFFGSERGSFATPTQCGTYAVHSSFIPWDETLASEHATQFFSLASGPGGAPCPGQIRPFAPVLAAASTSNAAAAHAPFWIDLTRNDGDQNINAVNVTIPRGLLATLAGIPYCPNAALVTAASPTYSGLVEQQSPSCPPASQVGYSTAGAGAGTHPVYLPGKVYLAGPYKGAPLSLAIITPAVSGPYDLGDVVVRAALHVDAETAQVTAASDPLPQIFEGIPARLRSILIDLDRQDFTLNPTNCDPLSVSASLAGEEGALANPTTPYQVANCSVLPFSPLLSLHLGGGLNRLGHPAIHAVLRTRPGEANLHDITVTLPSGELLDNSHIRRVCTKADFTAESCPAGSLLGHAEVSTPLLGQPLSGPIYLRTSGTGLPSLAVDLNGQIHVTAIAKISTVHSAYRTTFETVPDVPLGTVRLDLLGGQKGLLLNSEDLCGTHKHATANLDGQNGRALARQVPLQLSCSGSRKQHRRANRNGIK